ncbi:hypothetical protein KCP70_11900 [Salmonella enterica subsp. enterica]|nr:hypothetical protein KCP70_11900 [Salmonella enterica subsp. enterica]
MGGPSVLLAYIIADCSSFHHAFDGEMLFWNLLPAPFAVYAHRYKESFLAILPPGSYWFMWMAVVSGNYRHWGLRPVLVSGDGAVGYRR